VRRKPRAAAAAGIDPLRTRFWSVVAGGRDRLTRFVYLSLARLDLYSTHDGRTRFIALAAVIFGRWTPFGCDRRGVVLRVLLSLCNTRCSAPEFRANDAALPYLAALLRSPDSPAACAHRLPTASRTLRGSAGQQEPLTARHKDARFATWPRIRLDETCHYKAQCPQCDCRDESSLL